MTAILGKKLGMTQVFREDGTVVPVTVIEAGPCKVTAVREPERDGYAAVQLGFGTIKEKSRNSAELGQFKAAGVPAQKYVREIRDANLSGLEAGQTVLAETFKTGDYVDVQGITKGKGFAGVMKRHNFKGLRATHGVSISHRSHGSTGQRQDPGRVFKGKKMAGHLGDARITVQNLKIVRTDAAKGLILVSGAVPGADGGFVCISDAVKKTTPKEAPFPCAIKGQHPDQNPTDEDWDAQLAEAEAGAAEGGAKGEAKVKPAKKEAKGQDAKKEAKKE